MKLNHNKKSVKISLNLFALYAVMVCGIVFALPAFAASDPLVVVENLSTFIFSLIRAVGLILLGWGIVQVGLSLQSHDPSPVSYTHLDVYKRQSLTPLPGQAPPRWPLCRKAMRLSASRCRTPISNAAPNG